MSAESCSNCTYSRDSDAHDRGVYPLRCHYNPPSLVAGVDGKALSRFPNVQAAWWCGAWGEK